MPKPPAVKVQEKTDVATTSLTLISAFCIGILLGLTTLSVSFNYLSGSLEKGVFRIAAVTPDCDACHGIKSQSFCKGMKICEWQPKLMTPDPNDGWCQPTADCCRAVEKTPCDCSDNKLPAGGQRVCCFKEFRPGSDLEYPGQTCIQVTVSGYCIPTCIDGDWEDECSGPDGCLADPVHCCGLFGTCITSGYERGTCDGCHDPKKSELCDDTYGSSTGSSTKHDAVCCPSGTCAHLNDGSPYCKVTGGNGNY